MTPATSPFERDLADRLQTTRDAGLIRRLRWVEPTGGVAVRVDGKPCVSFASNDYLGLAGDPRLRQAAAEAAVRYGAGSGASRLISGSLPPHRELEEALAAFKGAPAALSFGSGYATALGVLTSVVGQGDTVVLDRLAHASLVDGARLSGARLRVFEHNNPAHLDRVLQRYQPSSGGKSTGRCLVVTESVFSMDGDVAPLRELVEIKDRHGAWLMVDEAHATGVFGGARRGLVDEFSLNDRVEIQMGTLGKALGAMGGYVAGSRVLIDFLVNRARSFIFSTAPVPAVAAAATAGLRVVQSEEGVARCERLWRRVHQANAAVRAAGFDVPVPVSPILPLAVGEETAAVAWSEALFDEGVWVPAVRFPAVARGAARLRLTLSAAHSEEDVARLGTALDRARRRRKDSPT